MKTVFNVLIDGPSRSGKLLLAKLLLSSPTFAFQHYSGDLESISEVIYFSRNNENSAQVLSEILRINLVHTINDLKSARQLSINENDSSYYKKTSFFVQNEHLFESGGISNISGDGMHGFILHTHESVLFLDYLRSSLLYNDIFSKFLQRQISIIRNPASQALSWLSRKYTDSWTNDSFSPFILYPCKYKLAKLSSSGVEGFPWYVEKSVDYYLNKGMILASSCENFNSVDLIALSVCYLTEIYISAFDKLSIDPSSAHHRFMVYHENLHDQPAADIGAILSALELEFDPNVLELLSENEASAERFGRKSINTSLRKLLKMVSCGKVANVLNSANELYQARLKT